MADNDTVDNGGLTDYTARTKDRAGVKTQIVGLDLNPAGTETLMGGSMPVTIASIPTVTEKQDQPAGTSSTWTSATALNTALTTAVSGYGTATIAVTVPSTVTGGVVTLEVSADGGTTYMPAGAVRVDNGWQENVISLALSPGIAVNRMYSVSVDAMTHVRARLSTVIAGTGNVVVTAVIVAGGIEPFVSVRPRQAATYFAGYRLASAASSLYLGVTFAANTDKQLATIYHAATATKTVRVRRISLLPAIGAAGVYLFEVQKLSGATAPATGNPAITPMSADSSDSAAEVTCLALPGTQGTVGSVNSPVAPMFSWNSAAAAATTNPYDVAGEELVLYDGTMLGERKPLTMRAGVAEGFAVVGRANAAITLSFTVFIEFTEEAP